MSRPKEPRHPRRPARSQRIRASTWLLAATQRSRLSWTSWSLKRTRRRETRASQRLLLLQLETDHQLLRGKELQQQRLQLEHRQRELAEARSFRRGTLPLPPSSPRQELDQLLGL